MEFRAFNTFVVKILREGRRLQKFDIAGQPTTRRRWTHTQLGSLALSILLCILLPTGINDNFAEYAIAFLGIFVGLFTSIIISLYDKGKTLYDGISNKSSQEKARIEIVRNYLVQFTGLTAYSIVLALIAVVMLLGVLLFPNARVDILQYHFVSSFAEVNYKSAVTFFRLSGVLLFRFTLLSLLLNFFAVTLFSLSSYFSFLMSEHKKLGLSPEEKNQ